MDTGNVPAAPGGRSIADVAGAVGNVAGTFSSPVWEGADLEISGGLKRHKGVDLELPGGLGQQMGVVGSVMQLIFEDEPIKQGFAVIDIADDVAGLLAESAKASGPVHSVLATRLATASQVLQLTSVWLQAMTGGGDAIWQGIKTARAEGERWGYLNGLAAALAGADQAWVRENLDVWDRFGSSTAEIARWSGYTKNLWEGFAAGSQLSADKRLESQLEVIRFASARDLAFTPHGDTFSTVVHGMAIALDHLDTELRAGTWSPSESSPSADDAPRQKAVAGDDDSRDATASMEQDPSSGDDAALGTFNMEASEASKSFDTVDDAASGTFNMQEDVRSAEQAPETQDAAGKPPRPAPIDPGPIERPPIDAGPVDTGQPAEGGVQSGAEAVPTAAAPSQPDADPGAGRGSEGPPLSIAGIIATLEGGRTPEVAETPISADQLVQFQVDYAPADADSSAVIESQLVDELPDAVGAAAETVKELPDAGGGGDTGPDLVAPADAGGGGDGGGGDGGF